ncbi:MAG: DUF4226 domain-containing protein [Mycobacterium sp.]|nr:DUF4226 domain-containing protein [Mycobacterium sp.]
MAQAGESGDALRAARRRLVARDTDLADADRLLAAAVADAHAIAVESIARIEAIRSEIESGAAAGPGDTAAAAREMGRQLVARNREIADLVRDAQDAVDAKTVVLKQLFARYTQQ